MSWPTYSFSASLIEVVSISLQQNLALKSARIGAQASSKDGDINRAKFLPSLNLSANTSWNENATHKRGADKKSDYNSHGYDITLSQSIFNLADIHSQSTSNIDFDIEQIKLKQIQQQIILDVTSAYFKILKNRAQVRATEGELVSSTARYRQIKRNIELGNVAGSEIYEVLAQKEQIANDLRSLNKDQRILVNKLENLVQSPVNVTYDLIKTAEFNVLENTHVVKLDSKLIKENLAIIISKQQVTRNRSLLRESGSDFLPSLSGSISYNYNDSNTILNDPLDTGRSNQTVYSLNLDVPITSGGSDYYQYKKKALELSQTKIEYQDQVKNIQQEFNVLINNINDNAESLTSLETIILANRSSYQGIQKAYKLGTRTITDLLAAESKMFKSIRDYENSRYSYVIDTLELESLLGSLDESTIINISSLMAITSSNSTESPVPVHLLDIQGQ
jgi:outer membrane protein